MFEKICCFLSDENGGNVITFILIVVVSALLIAIIYGSPSQGKGMAGGVKKAVDNLSNVLGQ